MTVHAQAPRPFPHRRGRLCHTDTILVSGLYFLFFPRSHALRGNAISSTLRVGAPLLFSRVTRHPSRVIRNRPIARASPPSPIGRGGGEDRPVVHKPSLHRGKLGGGESPSWPSPSGCVTHDCARPGAAAVPAQARAPVPHRHGIASHPARRSCLDHASRVTRHLLSSHASRVTRHASFGTGLPGVTPPFGVTPTFCYLAPELPNSRAMGTISVLAFPCSMAFFGFRASHFGVVSVFDIRISSFLHFSSSIRSSRRATAASSISGCSAASCMRRLSSPAARRAW